MRRRSKSANEAPLAIRPRDEAPSQESDQHFDIRRRKRVKFADMGLDSLPDHHASRRRHEAIQYPRSDVPKTSEYAYFRNIKNRSVPVCSSSLHKGNKDSKGSKINYLNTETSNASGAHKPNNKDPGHSVSEERMASPNRNTLFSPRVKLTCKAKLRSPLLSKNLSPVGRKLPMLPQNLTPIGRQLPTSPLNEAPEISGNQCFKKRIFSEKRERLCQWVVRTSSSEVQNFHSNGSNLVASLLSRLFPKGDECYDSSTRHSDNSKSLPFHKSTDLEKGPQLPHTRIWDENLPRICPGSSNDTVLSEWDTFIPGHPLLKCGSENPLEYDTLDLDERLKRQRSRISNERLDFSFRFPFERYGSRSYPLNEMEEFYSQVEHAKEEPHRLLLEWNPEMEKGGVQSCIVSYDNHEYAEKLFPSLATSWHNDYQKVMGYGIDVKAVCPSSLPAKYYVEFNSKSNYESPGCLLGDFEPNFEHVKYAVVEPDYFAPTLSYTPKCISLEEDRIAENALYSSNDMFSYGDQHWLKTEVWDGTPKFDSWQKSLYATNVVEEDPPPTFRTWQFPQNETRLFSFPRLQAACEEQVALFRDNAFDHHFSSPNIHESFHGSLDSLQDYPLFNISSVKI